MAWTLELVGAVGAGVAFLTGGTVAWQPVALAATVLAIAVGLLNYECVELLIIAMMLALVVVYVVVAIKTSPDPGALAVGFVPTPDSPGALTIAAGLLGTTALWQNFFLESILVEANGWSDGSDLSAARRGLVVGYAVGGVTTIAISLSRGVGSTLAQFDYA